MNTNNFREVAPNLSNRQYNEKPKDAIYNHVNYSIAKLGKKIKDTASLDIYAKHLNREQKVANADPALSHLNRIIKGHRDLRQIVESHNECVLKHRKDAVKCRDMVLTASPEWFQGKSEENISKWVKKNDEWLRMTYGENYLYGVLHRDEHTPHIHVIVGCRFFDEDKQVWKLQHCNYFNGIDKLQKLHDDYSDFMKDSFPDLNRPLKHQEAKYQDVHSFYGLINGSTLDLSHEDALKKLQYQDSKMKLLENKLKSLELYSKHQDKEISDLTNKCDKVEEELKKKDYVLDILKAEYSISNKEIESIENRQEMN